MAKTNIEVDLTIKDGDSVSQAEGKAKSLKQQLKEMKALLASGTLDANAFNKLAKEAGELQDRIGDVNQRVKNLASDSQKLEGFVSLAQGIVGGFSAVQGITALVGEENEDLQKTMVKLQAATSALAGIQAVANTLNKDSAALTALVTIRTQAQIVTQRIYTAVTGQATAATTGFKVALAVTGIGAVILLVTGLVYAMQKLTSATDEQEKALDKLNETLEANKGYLEDTLELYDQESKLAIIRARELGAGEETIRIMEGEARQKRIRDLQAFLSEQKELLRQWRVDDYADAEAAEEAYNTLADSVTESSKKLNEAIRADELATAEARLANIQQIKKANEEFDRDQERKRQERAEKEKRENERIAEQKKKESLRDFQQQLEDDAERKENAEIVAKEERQKELDAQARMIARGEAERALRIKLRNREEKEREEELQKIAAHELAKQQIISGSFDILNNIGELFIGQQYKQTAIGKTIALAQIATDTAKAISSLTAASEANPTNSVTYGLAGAAQFVAGLARITGNVLQAKRVLEGGSVGGGASTGTGSSISIPNSQPPRIDLNRGTAPQGTVKVVVLENDITTTVNRVIKIRENAEVE